MDKALLKRAAIESVALMLAVVTLSFALREYRVAMISASNLDDADASVFMEEDYSGDTFAVLTGKTDEDGAVELSDPGLAAKESGYPGLMKEADREIINGLGEQFLIIRKPLGDKMTIEIDDLYLTKSISIIINGHGDTVMDAGFIGRGKKGEFFVGEPICSETEEIRMSSDGMPETVTTKNYGNDPVHQITVTGFSDPCSGGYGTRILIGLDDVYANNVLEDENYYYICLKDPVDEYDKILVIDAGHGGKDAGAIAKDGHTYEKDLNLKILLLLKDMLDKEDIKVYYTRLTDETVYLRPRVGLANATGCDMFISIHCNSNEVSSPNGMEILYYDTTFKNINSKDLASIFSDEIAGVIPLQKRGLVKKQKDDIFILENALVPAMIIETGYLSNSRDFKYLIDENNMEDIARGIYRGIMRAYEEYDKEF